MEPVFDTHVDVRRSALVGVGAPSRQWPVLCVQLHAGCRRALADIRAELLTLGERHAHTRGIRDVFFHKGFPVDIPHNAKIGRETLAVWAAGQVSKRPR